MNPACSASLITNDTDVRFYLLHTYILERVMLVVFSASAVSLNDRAVTIHQTHDSVRITIFDPRFGSYHDFFVGGGRKKKRFLKQYFLLNNI